ncbi:N-acetyltransferase 10 [Globomyces sp. JEL0801]|nr:N-acetyltransferase 10 [Globomyces sp. JEL0801]
MSTPKQKKKLDSRIPSIINNGVLTNHRSFFVIVGDRGRDQVVTLHYLLSKARIKRPNVLWCYKKELSFSSHRKKRMNQIKKEIARGTRDADEDDPFECRYNLLIPLVFVSSTSIRYAYYKETDKILGNTYGMCILQDFEALTPNLLARTIETVEGGGIVVLLLKTMSSLKQLYTLTMDVHARYRTEIHQDTIARFNERFILSLGGCNMCLVVDDELNVLPLSAGKNVKPISKIEENPLTPEQVELRELQESMKDTQPVGSLISCAKTLDQAKAVLTFVEGIAEKTLRSTVTLTAARGRGKSASLGIAVAAAVSYGYSNIFLTSPSPENLKTLFEFIFKGFDALGYEEHLDYDILQSSNPAFQKAIWIQPSDHGVLAHAELLVIDEAAAIPLPTVKKLLGPYLVFMASTINGYEGTGRSLSMKLIKQLREQSSGKSMSDSGSSVVGRDGKQKSSNGNTEAGSSTASSRSLREIKLTEPIRYGLNDPVETWLNKLLCLDCCTPVSTQSRLSSGCPHPSKCELYYVTRDTLFSYHPVSEAFLQRMMALYVASHYKNTPNDLQLLSDAPAHHLFVLLPPTDESKATLPEPLCVIQVCMEGQIARGSALASLSRGVRASGDLIPWVVSQQFQDDDFASLSGARVVRIATHPDYIGMGYGARALEQLESYYNGQMHSLNENSMDISEEFNRMTEEELATASLKTDTVAVRDPSTMPPLLLRLTERPLKENLHWLGVSFGITQQLHKFWKRSGYTPVYLRQTANDLTGEHTCIMLKQLNNSGNSVKVASDTWLQDFSWDFRKRFLELLAYQFRSFSPSMVMGILEACNSEIRHSEEVYRHFSPFDLKRLNSYAQNLLDYHVILDLVPVLARLYFLNLLEDSDKLIKLSAVQGAILVGLGLQKKTVEELEVDLKLPVSQILALFAKAIRKSSTFLDTVVERGITDQVEQTVTAAKESNKDLVTIGKRNVDEEAEWDPAAKTLDEDLEEAGNEAMAAFKEKQRELIDSLDLKEYEIGGEDADWKEVKPNGGSNIVAVRNPNSSKKRKMEKYQGTAQTINDATRGITTGVVDSANTEAKIKEKKKAKHAKKLAKNAKK